MKPIIIFPQQPFEKGVDYSFIEEYDAALNAGFETVLIDIKLSIKFKTPFSHTPKYGIYRGWMLSGSDYKKLYYQLLNDYNIQLINKPFEYEAAHHFLNFYPIFSEVTIPSVITHTKEIDKKMLQRIGKQLGSKKLFLKDWVKSEPNNIVDADDLDGGLKIIEKFVENRGKSFEGGLVFRTFMELSQFENRYWVLGGEILDFDEKLPPIPNEIKRLLWKVKSNFFTIDLVRVRDTDQTIVLEIGDGQVSGLKGLNPTTFYKSFK